jgi:hypothetical protein
MIDNMKILLSFTTYRIYRYKYIHVSQHTILSFVHHILEAKREEFPSLTL